MSRTSALFAALCLVPPLAFAQLASAPFEGRLKKIQETKTIAVAYRPDALPFSFEDGEKKPAGYTVDLCRSIVAVIERQLGVAPLQVQWVPVTAQTRFSAISSGQADMECGASNERALAEAMKAMAVTATVVTVRTREEGLEQLEAGAIDAFASDRLLLVGLLGKSKGPQGLALLADALSFEPYAIAVPRGDWAMRQAVNSGLAQIFKSSALPEIYGRWFSALGRPNPVLEVIYGLGRLPE